jgi:cytochrome c-type biogenesis protein CcmH
MGEVATMIAGLETRLQRNPGDAQGWQMLGWSYMRTQRPADAAKAYGRAVAIDSKNVEYLSAQGEAMVRSEGKVLGDAADLFRRAVKGDPADPRALFPGALPRPARRPCRGNG